MASSSSSSSRSRLIIASFLICSGFLAWNSLSPSHGTQYSLATKDTAVFDDIYVVHLPARRDRAHRMTKLADALGLRITFFEATAALSQAITGLMEHVRREREREGWCFEDDAVCPEALDTKDDSTYHTTLLTGDMTSKKLRDAALQSGWTETSLFLPDAYFYSSEESYKPAHADLWPTIDGISSSRQELAVPCLPETSMSDIVRDKRKHQFFSYQDYNQRKKYNASMPVRATPLSRGEISCWHSHTSALRDFIASSKESILVLEDDVDMEWSLKDRIQEAWKVLPTSYDVVFLGHCWSHEDVFPPLDLEVPLLRPSHTPKCNHAYAVSKIGAQKMMRHLRSPGFAYSMPLDRAFTHLIATQRIEAYSLFPPIVVQTTDTISDIQSDQRKIWKDELRDSTLRRLGLL